MSNNKPPKINRTRVVINFTETDVNTDKPTKPALKQNLHQKHILERFHLFTSGENYIKSINI